MSNSNEALTILINAGERGAAGAAGAAGPEADIAVQVSAADAKATPVDSDVVPLTDSADSWSLKKLTWANIKTALKSYFDTVYGSFAAVAGLQQAVSGLQDDLDDKASAAHTHALASLSDVTVTGAELAADHSKLSGIEPGAQVNPSGASIKSSYEGQANTNAFTDAEKVLLGNQSGTNTGDQDLSPYQLKPSEGAFVDGDKTKLDGLSAAAADFSPLDLSPVLWATTRVAGSMLTAADAEAADGENVATWSDQSGNGNDLVQSTDSLRPQLDTDGGSGLQAGLVFTSDELECALASDAEAPWVAIVFKATADNTAMLLDSDGSSRVYLQRSSSGIYTASAGSTLGSIAIVQDEWTILLIQHGTDATASTNGSRDQEGATGSNSMDNVVLGRSYVGTSPSAMVVSDLIIGSGPLTRSQKNQLVTYLSQQCLIQVPDQDYFKDAFLRPDSSDNDYGLADTGHEWTTNGSGSAKGRIMSHGLTHDGDLTTGGNTCYFNPKINFIIGSVEWLFSSRDEGGTDQGFGAILLSKEEETLSDMVHFVWGVNSWRLERFMPAYNTPPGTNTSLAHTVAERTLNTSPTESGRYKLEYDYENGVVIITDPDNVVTYAQWDKTLVADHQSGFSAAPLSDYQTPFLQTELLVENDPAGVITYDSVEVTEYQD